MFAALLEGAPAPRKARATRLAPGVEQPQADVDSAFRRIPLEADAWDCAYVIFQRHGVVMAAMHLAVFFGALSSVHNWARIGALLAGILRIASRNCLRANRGACPDCHVRRMIVHIPSLRFVDDYYGAEAPCLVQHTLQ